MSIISKKFRLLILLIIVVQTLSLVGKVAARPLHSWSRPEWIPGLVDNSPDQAPYFIADPTGMIHVFHSQWVGSNFSIVYSRWSVGVGWTEPVDIIFLPTGQARICGAFLDNKGMMNVIFWGGDDQAADIYYSSAPATAANKSTAWSAPQIIARDAISPVTAAVSSNGDGTMVVVYSGNTEGNGLYSVVTTDSGITWSNPNPIFLASSDTLWPSALQLYQTGEMPVYAVWGLGDETGNSRSVFFARFDLEEGWTAPIILADAIEYEADTPQIIEQDATLMVIYHNGFPTTRWMIQSRDRGQTWTSPVRLFQQVGSNGAAALVIDSGNQLHMFFGNRVGQPATHGLWHSIWSNGSWSEPVPIVSGPQILVGENGEEGFDPSSAQAIISRGNLLLVVWRHDPMAGPNHIWYSYDLLNTPATPIETLPAPTLESSGSSDTQNVVQEVKTIRPTFDPDIPFNTSGIDGTNPSQILLASIGPTLILILIIFIATNLRKSK